MRCLDNKIIRTLLFIILMTLLIPILTYIVEALLGLGRIMGTYIRILGTI